MMHYELKDKKRQAVLAEALPGFMNALQEACETRVRELKVNACVRLEHFSVSAPWSKGEWTLALPTADLEVIEDYDPNQWNEYPRVTPPEKVWMRIEMLSQDGGIKTRDVAFYKAGRWCKFPLDNGEVILGRLRFRPWDEEAAK